MNNPSGCTNHKRLSRRNRLVLFLAVTALGISAFVTQLVLLREALSVLSGNELIFGLILASWFLLTGLGAQLGRFVPSHERAVDLFVIGQLIVATAPLVSTAIVRGVPPLVFPRGIELGPVVAALGCLLVLAPYCITAGYLLTLTCYLLAEEGGSRSIGHVYFLDVIGDIIGGITFSLLLVWWLNHLQMLYLCFWLNTALAFAVSLLFRRKLLLAVVAVLTFAAIPLFLLVDWQTITLRWRFPGQKLLFARNSPYGRLVITAWGNQINFYHSGVRLFSTGDIARVEETVYPVLAQRPDAEKVLLIGGGITGTAKAAVQWGVKQVDYVELDPVIVQAAKQHLPELLLPEQYLTIYRDDGRAFINHHAIDKQYDVIIVDVPPPSTSQLNRFYTLQFFQSAKLRLRKNGVVAVFLGHFENYLSPELAVLLGSLHRTMNRAFKNVILLPTDRVAFLASDGSLTTDIAQRVALRNVNPQWLNQAVLRDMLQPLRINTLQSAANIDAAVNTDFSPVLYYYQLRFWLAKFRTRLSTFFAVAGLIVFAFLVRMRAVSWAIFTTGFAASSLEMIIILGFQSLCGSVYYWIGIIVTMFMLGLALGAAVSNRLSGRYHIKHLVLLEWSVAAFCVVVPLVFWALGQMQAAVITPWATRAATALLAMLLACLVGMEFPMAAAVAFRGVSETASELYLADYLGSALGALVVSTLLVPWLGMMGACGIVAAANLATGLILLFTR